MSAPVATTRMQHEQHVSQLNEKIAALSLACTPDVATGGAEEQQCSTGINHVRSPGGKSCPSYRKFVAFSRAGGRSVNAVPPP